MRLLVLLCLLLLPLSAFAEAPRILFDEGHRQAFLIEKEGPLQLSKLAGLFQQHGWQVGVSNGVLTEQTLAATDALVISGAFAPLSPQELDNLMAFLQNGGKLAVMIHIGQPILPLLHQLGVDVATRVINDPQQQPNGKTIDFSVSNFQPHLLTEGLEQFNIYGGWPLQVFEQSGKAIARSSAKSWVDIDNNKQLSPPDVVSSFDVIISGDYGQGGFAIFADDAIFQNQFLQDGNRKLAENLISWFGQVKI